jgi:hypothetical protein
VWYAGCASKALGAVKGMGIVLSIILGKFNGEITVLKNLNKSENFLIILL